MAKEKKDVFELDCVENGKLCKWKEIVEGVFWCPNCGTLKVVKKNRTTYKSAEITRLFREMLEQVNSKFEMTCTDPCIDCPDYNEEDCGPLPKGHA
jgi:hypothetical protein